MGLSLCLLRPQADTRPRPRTCPFMIARADLIDVLFVIVPHSLLLDIAGPAEAFRLANQHRELRGLSPRFRLRFAGPAATPADIRRAGARRSGAAAGAADRAHVGRGHRPADRARASGDATHSHYCAVAASHAARRACTRRARRTACSRSARAHCSPLAPDCSALASAPRITSCSIRCECSRRVRR